MVVVVVLLLLGDQALSGRLGRELRGSGWESVTLLEEVTRTVTVVFGVRVLGRSRREKEGGLMDDDGS